MTFVTGLLALSQPALANPPRLEVFGGWSGSASQSYAYATVQPALLRSEDASFVLRTTVHRVHYTYREGDRLAQVDATGTSIGPGFVYSPGKLAIAMAVGLHAQHAASVVDGTLERGFRFDASLEGNALWHPWPQAQLYGVFNFNAANPYLWARSGVTHAVVPLRIDAPVSLRLGVEATSSGTFQSRVLELGPVVEVPVRPVGLVVSARGGVALDRSQVSSSSELSPTLGIGVYWAM
jgi:hypothetical protein